MAPGAAAAAACPLEAARAGLGRPAPSGGPPALRVAAAARDAGWTRRSSAAVGCGRAPSLWEGASAMPVGLPGALARASSAERSPSRQPL